jgi:lipoate-protein ligase B
MSYLCVRSQARSSPFRARRRSNGSPTYADALKEMEALGAIRVRVRRRSTFHCVASNVAPNLDYYSGIALRKNRGAHYGVTRIEDLGRGTTVAKIDAALRTAFRATCGPTAAA